MRTDHYFDSCGKGRIHYCKWMPEGKPRAVLQILHGIAEHVERYDDFARYLTSQGYVVVAEDHMGHGGSIGENGVRGYFHGGWFAAVDDSMRLMKDTMADYPDVPYILFGHSMVSFMARTVLAKYPDSGIAAAIICGTGWQPTFALPVLAKLIDTMGKKNGEEAPNEQLDKLIFGGYTKGFDNVRTPKDWLSRDPKVVDAYIADPLCGFVASSGLLRDMMLGIHYIQQPKHMENMKKHLPVFFIAGDKDPVGANGKGVKQAAEAFRKAGMINVALKLYPDCRHEILNELNKQEVYEDITQWIAMVTNLEA